MTTQMQTITRGGAWLIEDATEPIFTPERLSDEHRLIRQTADEFVASEVLPVIDRLEQKDWALARALVRRCGDLGLLGTDVPEAYGGVELDKVSSIVVGEAVGRAASFATTFGAETSLAITPLLCFGTEEQKQRYLPGLVSGEIVGAYALSESGSGSDALGAKARAVRQPDGSFVLNGEKMWITNGGFADLFLVFAKVDSEQFTAFLVERELSWRQLGSGRAQARAPRIVHDSAAAAGSQGSGEPRPRRGRPRPQGGLQRAELRTAQAGCQPAAAGPSWRSRRQPATQPRVSSSVSRSGRSAPSATSSPRWRFRNTRSSRCFTGPVA